MKTLEKLGPGVLYGPPEPGDVLHEAVGALRALEEADGHVGAHNRLLEIVRRDVGGRRGARAAAALGLGLDLAMAVAWARRLAGELRRGGGA